MKKLIITVLILLVTVTVFAQEEEELSTSSKIAIGIGPEFNMNSRENFAGGVVLGFDYGFANVFALGASFTVSNNFDEIMVLEPAVLFRWYFLGSEHSSWFLQADVGAYLVLEDDETETLFLGGLRGGIRIPMGKMYVEPYGRVGYPFVFGAGVLVGLRF